MPFRSTFSTLFELVKGKGRKVNSNIKKRNEYLSVVSEPQLHIHFSFNIKNINTELITDGKIF